MEKLPISNTRSASLFAMDGIPHFFEALPLALQHVVAMIVGSAGHHRCRRCRPLST